jgi:hypothetical protein
VAVVRVALIILLEEMLNGVAVVVVHVAHQPLVLLEALRFMVAQVVVVVVE